MIIEPVLAEKADKVRDKGVYVFKVAMSANKSEIKKAIEHIFKVKVQSVNILIQKGEVKRAKFRYKTKTEDFKKAYVKLAPNNTIPLFEGI